MIVLPKISKILPRIYSFFRKVRNISFIFCIRVKTIHCLRPPLKTYLIQLQQSFLGSVFTIYLYVLLTTHSYLRPIIEAPYFILFEKPLTEHKFILFGIFHLNHVNNCNLSGRGSFLLQQLHTNVQWERWKINIQFYFVFSKLAFISYLKTKLHKKMKK